jgi:hypothetical protein
MADGKPDDYKRITIYHTCIECGKPVITITKLYCTLPVCPYKK